MRARMMLAMIMAGLFLAGCGGDDANQASPADQNVSGDDVGNDVGISSGDVFATVVIDGDTWELTNVACVVRADSFEFIAADGIIGASSGPTLSVRVTGDPLDTESGVAEVAFFSGPMTNPDMAWTSSTGVGAAVVRTDGSRASLTGSFDNVLTDSVEAVDGTVEADCGEMPEVPVATTTLPPDYEVDGTVTVGGETYEFTYDPKPGGRCGGPGNEGRVLARGWMVDDPSREVLFTYGLPEETTDGAAHMQLIIYGSEGEQLWYSAVGLISGSSTGSIDSLSREGNTVTASGTLQRSGSNPEELAPFTIEATCNQ